MHQVFERNLWRQAEMDAARDMVNLGEMLQKELLALALVELLGQHGWQKHARKIPGAGDE